MEARPIQDPSKDATDHARSQIASQSPTGTADVKLQSGSNTVVANGPNQVSLDRATSSDDKSSASDSSTSDAQKKLQKNRERRGKWLDRKNPKKASKREQAKVASAEERQKNPAAVKLNAMEEDRRRSVEAARRREMEEHRRRSVEEARRREQEAARRASAQKNRALKPSPKMQPNKPDMRKAAGKQPGFPQAAFMNQRGATMKEGMAGVDSAHKRNSLTSVILIVAACLVVAGLIFLLIFFALSGDDSHSTSGTSSSTGTMQSSSSSASSNSSTVTDGDVIYKYIAATNAGVPYTVWETVTFGEDGKCISSTLDMTFPDAESAKAFTESLARGQKDTFTLDELDGEHAVVTIDNHELGLDSSAYENALRYSVSDLEVIRD